MMHLEAGHTMAREQFVLGKYNYSSSAPKADGKKVEIKYSKNDKCYVVSGNGFEVKLSKKTGELCSYKKDGVERLERGIRPQFSRANIDNERMAQVPFEWVKTSYRSARFRQRRAHDAPCFRQGGAFWQLRQTQRQVAHEVSFGYRY